MATYTEYVEAVQFKRGHSSVMACIDLAERAGFEGDWQLSAECFRFGCDGCDGYKYYVQPGQWLVLRADNTIEVFAGEVFNGRFRAMPDAAS